VQAFWETVSEEQKGPFFKCDPVLRFFDTFSILEVIEGKLLKFDVDKTAELQDRIDKVEACVEDQPIRDVFAPGATRNPNVRTHKLVKIIKDRLSYIVENDKFVPTESHPRAGDKIVWRATRSLCLAHDLPAGAKINLRIEPHAEAAVADAIDASSVITAFANVGDWFCVESEQGELWVLSRTPDRVLLVDFTTTGNAISPMEEAPPQPPHQHVEYQPPQQHAEYQPAQKHVEYQPVEASFSNTPVKVPRGISMTPVNGQDDPTRYVTLAEHNRLRYKVAQLEADMRALRLLLRSWSLDTPASPSF